MPSMWTDAISTRMVHTAVTLYAATQQREVAVSQVHRAIAAGPRCAGQPIPKAPPDEDPAPAALTGIDHLKLIAIRSRAGPLPPGSRSRLPAARPSAR